MLKGRPTRWNNSAGRRFQRTVHRLDLLVQFGAFTDIMNPENKCFSKMHDCEKGLFSITFTQIVSYHKQPVFFNQDNTLQKEDNVYMFSSSIHQCISFITILWYAQSDSTQRLTPQNKTQNSNSQRREPSVKCQRSILAQSLSNRLIK